MTGRYQKILKSVCNMCCVSHRLQRLTTWTVLRNLKFSGRTVLTVHQKCPLKVDYYAITGMGVGFSIFGIASCYSRKQANIRDLCRAAGEGDVYVLMRLIDEGVDVNETHALGWTALHAAALSGNSQVVKLLLDAGADVNARDQFSSIFKTASKKGMRAFDVSYMRDECFSYRLKKNADFADFTPLHYAALSDDFETTQLLLNAGADPTLNDVSGHSAEDYADKNKEYIKSFCRGYAIKKNAKEAEERKKYPIEKRFGEVIVGQEGAINAVASAIRRRENGWCDEEHPLVFLFLGSSGIGKTELAKQLAKYLHKDLTKGFIRLDMSEYQEKHEVAKLIGAPPGYIGHDQGGQLTKKLSNFPQAVVLFDEVDKAHPDVLTVLLQLFDEGRLTDGHGKTIECKEAIFVMTSNLASGEIANHALQLRRMAKEISKEKYTGKVEPKEDAVTIDRNFKENIVYPILKRHFQRDEFLGRITEFVYFLPFSKSELMQLVEKELEVWASRASKNHSIELSWDNDVLDVLADGYDIHYGARSIKHEVERNVVNQIAAAHERDIIKQNSQIHLVAEFATIENDENNKSELKKPVVKIQLIEGDNDNTKNVKEIFLEDLKETNGSIFF